MTPTEYRAVRSMNATAIKAGAKSMLHMHHVLTGERDEPSPAMKWGSLVHGFVLGTMGEPVVWPGRKAGKEWDSFKASAEANGSEVVSASELAKLEAIRAMIRTNPDASGLLVGGMAETPVKWDEPGIGPCKALPDYRTESALVDLKTAKDISERGFAASSWSLGYHLQMAWYRRGLRANGWTGNAVAIIAVESAAPYDVAVYRLDPALLNYGETECLRIAKAYRAAEQAGNFPGAHPFARELLPPAWADEMVSGIDFEDAADQE